MAILYDNEGNQINMSEVNANASDIADLKSRMTTAEEDITSLDDRLDTAEPKITTLETTTSIIQNDIITNIIKTTLATATYRGITCTNNGDGTYTLNGTADGDVYFDLTARDIVFKKGTYKLLGCPEGGSSATYFLFINNVGNDFGSSVNITINNDITSFAGIFVKDGQEVTDLTFKPMLTTNLDATLNNFVQYTGNTGHINSDLASLEARVTALET